MAIVVLILWAYESNNCFSGRQHHHRILFLRVGFFCDGPGPGPGQPANIGNKVCAGYSPPGRFWPFAWHPRMVWNVSETGYPQQRSHANASGRSGAADHFGRFVWVVVGFWNCVVKPGESERSARLSSYGGGTGDMGTWSTAYKFHLRLLIRWSYSANRCCDPVRSGDPRSLAGRMGVDGPATHLSRPRYAPI